MVYSGCNSSLIYSALPPSPPPPFLFSFINIFSSFSYSGDLCTPFLISKPLLGGGNDWEEAGRRASGSGVKARRSGGGRPGRAGGQLGGPGPPGPQPRRGDGQRERGREGGMDGRMDGWGRAAARLCTAPAARAQGWQHRRARAARPRRAGRTGPPPVCDGETGHKLSPPEKARNGHDGHSGEAGQRLKRGCLRGARFPPCLHP